MRHRLLAIVLLLGLASCGTPPRPAAPPEEPPDDLMLAPADVPFYTYGIPLHRQELRAGVIVGYRAQMRAHPGDLKRVLVSVMPAVALPPPTPQSPPRGPSTRVTARVERVPPGLTVDEGTDGRRTGTLEVYSLVYMVTIAPDARPGDYRFQIAIAVNNVEVGSVPCTVRVEAPR
jgi:hypothetical protein